MANWLRTQLAQDHWWSPWKSRKLVEHVHQKEPLWEGQRLRIRSGDTDAVVVDAYDHDDETMMKIIMKMMMMMIHHLKLEDRSFVAGKVEFFHVRARALHFVRKKYINSCSFHCFILSMWNSKLQGVFFTVPPYKWLSIKQKLKYPTCSATFSPREF